MKKSIRLCLLGLALVSGCAGAGTGNFVVPPCNASAVVETATSFVRTKDAVNPRTAWLSNIRQVTYHPNENRTCVATVKDKRGRNRDFFYQVIITSGINWVVSDVSL